MYSKIFTLVFYFYLVNCNSLMIYVPHKGPQNYVPYPSNPSIDLKISVPENKEIYFASSNAIFMTKNIKNLYGDFSYLLQRDILIYPELYFKNGSIPKKIEITINKFDFNNNDKCFSNSVELDFEASIVSDGKQKQISFKKNYNTLVTDCVTTVSIITIFPLIWYIPYIGWKGNREDQFNSIGKNLMLFIVKELEVKK